MTGWPLGEAALSFQRTRSPASSLMSFSVTDICFDSGGSAQGESDSYKAILKMSVFPFNVPVIKASAEGPLWAPFLMSQW